MIDRAINKIQTAIDGSSDPMEQVLGQQIIDNITTNTRAGMILEEGKTLAGCKRKWTVSLPPIRKEISQS